MNLFELIGKISIDKTGADSAIDETASKAENLSSSAENLGSTFQEVGQKTTDLGKKMAPVSAAAAVVGTGMVAAAKKTADYTDNIDKQSQKLGISRKAYQEWDYVLSQNGASIDSMKVGLKTLNNIMDGVNQKADTSGTAFERLGLKYDDLKGKSQEEIFDLTIKKLQECTDETERTKLATELFGKAGVELAPLLNSGAESTEELKKRAKELGLVLDDDVIDAGVNFTDAMDTMQRSLATTGMVIASSFMPVMTDIANWFSEHQGAIKAAVEGFATVIRAIPEPLKVVLLGFIALTAALSPFLILTGKIISSIGVMISAFGKVKAAMNIVGVIQKVGGAFQALFALLAANPIILVIAAIAALVAAFIYLWNTNEEFRQFWIDLWNNIVEVVTNMVTALSEFLTGAFDAITNAYKAFENGLNAAITAFCSFVSNLVTTFMSGISTTVTTVLGSIQSFFVSAWSTICSAATSAMSSISNAVSSGMNAAGSIVSSVLNGIKSAFSNVWDGAVNIVTGAIDRIKSIMNFDWSLPHLKLPHISVSGSFSLMPPKVPNFSISWYKKAYDSPMLLDEPTVFGYSQASGKLLGGGDGNGSEVVAGSKTLMGMIGDAVGDANGDLLPALNEIIAMMASWRAEGSGDTVVPVYIGNDMLDELIIGSKKRVNLRSGGLANA